MERQIYKTKTKQIRVDSELHRRLKIIAADKGVSVKTLLEKIVGEKIVG